MGDLPVRPPGHPAPRDLLARLAAHVGETGAAQLCAELLAAQEPDEHRETLLYLGGDAGRSVLEGDGGWKPYWSRVWGARGLLYVWDDSAAGAVLDGLDDPAWRVAEMCLKVAARRGLPAGDGAVRLADHELPRVRAAAMRALGAAGDVEHVAAAYAATSDEAEEVRRAAARALEQMSDRLDLPDPPAG